MKESSNFLMIESISLLPLKEDNFLINVVEVKCTANCMCPVTGNTILSVGFVARNEATKLNDAIKGAIQNLMNGNVTQTSYKQFDVKRECRIKTGKIDAILILIPDPVKSILKALFSINNWDEDSIYLPALTA